MALLYVWIFYEGVSEVHGLVAAVAAVIAAGCMAQAYGLLRLKGRLTEAGDKG